MNQKLSAKKAFLNDLKNDSDFQQHKKNAQWKQVRHSEYIRENGGYYTAAAGSFGVANAATNDLAKLRLN